MKRGDLIRVVVTSAINDRRRGLLAVVTLSRAPDRSIRLKPGVLYVEYLHGDGTMGWNWSENLELVQSRL